MRAQVGIYGIGNLGGGANYSEVRAAILTSNGIVAVGGSNGQSWDTVANGAGGVSLDTAVLWTKGSGAGVLQALPPVVAPDINNITRVVTAGDVTEVSSGNLVIAARSYYNATPGFSATNPNAKEEVIYSYTFNGTAATYGSTTPLLPNVSAGNQNAANAISRDGSVVYGFTGNGNLVTRWTSASGTLANLGTAVSGDTGSIPAARGVSSDGSVMVGTRTLADGVTTKAFTYNGTFTTIGTLSGGTNSQSLAVSANGSIVFGTSESTLHPNGEAFFWTSSGGFTALGTPNDAWIPNVLGGITADGSVAIVDFENGSTPNSYLFNSHGMFSLTSVLTAGGVDFSGWSNLGAQGISPDGQLIFGQGLHGGNIEGFVAEIPSGLVSAIPEPTTYALLGGFAAMAFTVIARRKRSSRDDA